MASVSKILSSIKELPAMPNTVIQVTAMINSGEPDFSDIEKIIRSDEALSMLVLRAANSVMYGTPGKTFDLKQGIGRLGTRNLMKLLLQQKVADVFNNAGNAYGMRRGDLRRSAMGGAVAGETVAKRHNFDQPDLCYVCGLLRDIGKIALDHCYGESYRELIEKHQDSDRSFVECERDALGVDHAHIGAELALHWGLPERIADAIRFHHEPPEGEKHDELFDIVHAGDAVSLWAGMACGDDGMQYQLSEEVRDRLELDRSAVEGLIVTVWDTVSELEQALSEPVSQR